MGPDDNSVMTRASEVGGRRPPTRTGGRREGDPAPLPISPEGLDALIDALEDFAGVVPSGRALFTAIYDAGAGASDLIIRDRDGETRLILGLENAQHHRLETLLAWVRGELEGDPREVGGSRTPSPPEEAGSSAASTGVGTSEAAHSAELDYRAILELSPCPLIIVDDETRIEYASPAVVNRLGMRDPVQLVGLTLPEVIHPDDHAAVLAQIGDEPGEPVPVDVRLLRWDGLYSRAEASVSVVPGGGRQMLALTASSSAGRDDDRTAARTGERRWQMRAGGPEPAVDR